MALLGLLTLLAWSTSSPAGSSPDDDFHATSIWCGWGSDDVDCVKTGVKDERSVPFNPPLISCYAFKPTDSAACQPEFSDRSERTVVARGNYQGLYPPVYYAAMHPFVGSDFDDSVLRIRIVNSIIAVSVIGLLACLIPTALRRPLLWGFLGSSVPLGLFVMGSINPSGWAFVSAGTLWIGYYAAFAAEGWRRSGLAVFSVIVLLMGSGSRGDACLFSSLAVVVVMILRWGVLRANLRMTLLGAAMVVVSAALFLGSNQSAVATSGLPAAPELLSKSPTLSLAIDNAMALPYLLTGMFGSWGLGWLDTYTDPIVFQGALAVFVGLAFVGLSRTSIRKSLVVALVATSFVAFPLLVLLQSKQIVGQSVQPRYLLPLVIMLIGLCLLPTPGSRALVLSPPQVVFVVLALSVAQAVALHANIRRYVTGAEINGLNLNRATEWWWDIPVTPMAVWIIGSTSFALLAAMILPMTSRETVLPSISSQPQPPIDRVEAPSPRHL
jgi:hypothetical protein